MQQSEKRKSRLGKRAFIALLMFFSGLWLPLSGIPMHFLNIAPVEPFRHIVMAIHNTASIIFLVSVTIHMIFNWKSLSRYMVSKTNEHLAFRKELVLAAVIVTALILLIGTHPFHIR
jgi:hypothetical protein